MKMRMMIASIKRFLLMQVVLLLLLLISLPVFINVEVAFISALLIILGSMYSYARLVTKRLHSGETPLSDDLVEQIDDPYDLYSDEVTYDEQMELKEIIKEEKKRLKTHTFKNVKAGSGALISWYRMVPYLFLILGFMALNNNGLLLLAPYLSGLGLGIVGGYFIGKHFIQKS